MLALVHPSPAHSTTKPRTRTRPPQTPDIKPEHVSQHPPKQSSNPPTTLDIDSYPPQKLLKLLASLLTQIAATNDALSPAASLSPSSSSNALNSVHMDNPLWRSLTSASRSALSTPSATLTFHARNIPTISLEAYLLRIVKYCPTTNQVFLSLLVYFDRMSKLTAEATTRTFVIDSFNIHRLVIAGVTVASKFFSDVFYTNSRYAKVGGLPLSELNQLELQFLLLNDFRLVISSSEMQRYAEQLLIFSQSHSDYVSPLSLTIPPTSTQDQTPTITPVAHTRPSNSPPSIVPPSVSHQQPPDQSSSHSVQTTNTADAYSRHMSYDMPRGYVMTREHHHSHQPPFNGPSYPSSAGPSNNSINGTPNGRLVRRDSISTDGAETETENETGTETGTETDADADDTSTTDDEPTVRPGRMSITGSVYSVNSISSTGSGSSGGRNGGRENAVNGHALQRSDAESDVCSVRSFDTGDEGGDEYENDEDMDEDGAPSSPTGTFKVHVPDDCERTPETNAEMRDRIKRTQMELIGDGKVQRGIGERLDVDWEGDMRMRSPKP